MSVAVAKKKKRKPSVSDSDKKEQVVVDAAPEEATESEKAVEEVPKISFGDAIAEYISLQHRVAVVNLLLKYLEPYTPSDAMGVSSVHHDRNCLNPVVSVEAFDEVWLRLLEMKEEFEDQMASLQGLTIPKPPAVDE